jgi:hypothetical protein
MTNRNEDVKKAYTSPQLVKVSVKDVTLSGGMGKDDGEAGGAS